MPNAQNKDAAVTPTETDVVAAKATVNLIKHFASTENPVRFQVGPGRDNEDMKVPAAAEPLFLTILNKIAEGHSVEVIAHERELTTQEAADILRVSRPYLVRLLDEERIPSHRVGTHRRVLHRDIKTYCAERWSRRKATLDKLSALDQELGLSE